SMAELQPRMNEPAGTLRTGTVVPAQLPHTPAEQVWLPVAQVPRQARVRLLATAPLSSMSPLQSSSTLLQLSAVGETPPEQAPQTPEEQVWLPVLQAPTLLPQILVRLLAITPLSSMSPLQSSSMSLQVSGVGPRLPTQAPQLPAVQVWA